MSFLLYATIVQALWQNLGFQYTTSLRWNNLMLRFFIWLWWHWLAVVLKIKKDGISLYNRPMFIMKYYFFIEWVSSNKILPLATFYFTLTKWQSLNVDNTCTVAAITSKLRAWSKLFQEVQSDLSVAYSDLPAGNYACHFFLTEKQSSSWSETSLSFFFRIRLSCSK